jgi:ubiquinone/menaquinone biosynthesis C-methylase UbiE
VSENKWRSIWNKKKVFKYKKINLSKLIKLNGYDSLSSKNYNLNTWKILIKDFLNRSKLNPQKKILEIGCGCGAFIYACNKIVKANYYGVDYSKNLILMAKKIMPNANFVVNQANSKYFEDLSFDVIFAHGVFHYFPNKKYVFSVIKKNIKKLSSKGILIIMDLNNKKYENIYHKERSSLFKNPEEYNKKYYGLKNLFFEKNELKKYLTSNNFKSVKFFNNKAKNVFNSKFKFNLIAHK